MVEINPGAGTTQVAITEPVVAIAQVAEDRVTWQEGKVKLSNGFGCS